MENPTEHPLTIIPYVVICYNNSINKAYGFTPYELLFGYTSSRRPETLYNKEELISKYIRDKQNFILLQNWRNPNQPPKEESKSPIQQEYIQ